ncbi:MAG: hypothetical protein IT285_13800 [Bdellovibrionales bacterium]|nr:hypothetical protein [Bdellovibrionales bacterium]
MNRTPSKLQKNQFKCFHCRKVFAQRDGNWFAWGMMQVHLCWNCDKATAKRAERAS